MPKIGAEPKRRADIINAALECICDMGIDSITLEMVAKKAQCSKGVVNYYFLSKLNLILEAFRAFLSYYQIKIDSAIKKEMTAYEMLEVVIYHGLPSREPAPAAGSGIPLNVSNLEGLEAMNISENKKSKLFIHFYSKAIIHEEFQRIIKDVYQRDITGIASIIDYGIHQGLLKKVESKEAAFTLLSMIIGMSVFRVVGFQLDIPERDNKICLDFIQGMLKK